VSLVPWLGRRYAGGGQQRSGCALEAGAEPATLSNGTAPPGPTSACPLPLVTVTGQDGSAIPRQELAQEAPLAEDLAMATLLRAADRNTLRSIKQAILMYMLIRAVRRPVRGRRRPSLIAVSLLASIGAAHIAHWHIWPLLLQLCR
jgi:hypothetical protein